MALELYGGNPRLRKGNDTGMRMRVYIAGPYSLNPAECTARAIDIAERITELGAVPFVPHLNHHWDVRHPHPWSFWLQYDLEWLPACHALFRIEGDSPGADLEVEDAFEMGIPIFFTLEDLAEHIKKGKAVT